ncbi:MAG: prepilin peptidase [Clostridia bacterium]|nr:prepilin peptidase [Clostridia bacterium]
MLSELSPFMIIYLSLISFILGLVMGSFCNAWAWRIVNGERIQKGRSHCPKCGHTLAAADLVPLFSWLFLKGRCRYCKEPISKRYPLAELISGLWYLSMILRFGFTLTILRFFILGSLLLVLSLVDIDTMELPGGLMTAAAAASLIRLAENLSNWKSMAWGLVPAVVLLGIVLIMDKILGKESMGGGDIKLLAVLGLHLGAAQTVLLLMISCVIGLVAARLANKDRKTPFPFGPSLALAAWITALIGEPVINVYLSFF